MFLPSSMKVGDKVTHKLSGQVMTIKRLTGTVATCILEVPKPFKFWGIEHPGDIAVCAVENLIPKGINRQGANEMNLI